MSTPQAVMAEKQSSVSVIERGQRKNGVRKSALRLRARHIGLVAFVIFILAPTYWLIAMSFKPNTEIITQLTLSLIHI